jgi:hypothetical protein
MVTRKDRHMDLTDRLFGPLLGMTEEQLHDHTMLLPGDYIVNGNDSLTPVEGVTLGSGYHDKENDLYYGVRDGRVVSSGKSIECARYPDRIDAMIQELEGGN